MTQTLHLEPSDPAVKTLVPVAFPTYKGRTFKVRVHEQSGMDLQSSWDGGSRDYFVVIRLSDLQTLEIPTNGNPFVPSLPDKVPASLPAPGFVVIEHSIFCGKDCGITIHLHKENAVKFLPATTELTWAEKVVLSATCSLKASYQGISNYRFVQARSETGITQDEYEAAKAALISRKFLNAAGAITTQGRNSIASPSGYGSISLHTLARERA